MSMMTVCPECKAQVGVPEGTHPTAQVRCPLCEVEFSFGESIPDDLPEVVVVDPGFAEPAAEEAALAAAVKEAEEASAQTAEETDADTAVKTEDGATAETQWFTPDAGGETVESEFSFDPFGDMDSSDDDKRDDSEQAAGEEGEKEEGGVATADEDEEAIGEPAFSFSPFGESDGDSPDFGGTSFGESSGEGGTATAAPPKPKKKSMGLKGQVIGIVVFGIIGLGLGYGILKMVKPAAAAPFDDMFAGAWNSVASLWGGGSASNETAATGGGGETGKRQASNSNDDGGIGLPGGMLDRPPSQQDLDNALAGTQTPNIDDDLSAAGGADGADDDPFVVPNPVEVEPSPKLTFRSLLAGQPDASGVFAQFDSSESQAALEKALNVSGDDSSNLASVYFALCDLGHKLALAPDVDDPEVSVQLVDAEQLLRLAAPTEKHASFEKFSNQWLQFGNRPPAFKDKVGVFLVGKVSKVRKNARVASLYATEVTIPASGGSARPLIVLTAKDPGLGNGETVGVLGMTVQDAEAKLPGYDASAIIDEFGSAPPLIVLAAAVSNLD